MSVFKAPDSIPQDLLLIQEMVGAHALPQLESAVVRVDDDMNSESDDIKSSDGENSEDEIEAKLFQDTEESQPTSPVSVYHLSSDSSSDSEPEEEVKKDGPAALDEAVDDDDEDPLAGAETDTYLHTKHEIVETDITIPEAEKVDPNEPLEKVGDIINIIDQVAIVRGLPSDNMNRGSQKALDSETLLVFEDRNVMGYIYETFGPTNQPLYQVKYNRKYPLDPGRVKPGRPVFMMPSKTKFVFVDQIKFYRGSDASNVYDEEPADDELEFSDDEAEAMYRGRMKRKRGESRSRSAASSQEPALNPSQMRDHELVDDAILGRNAYDEHGPYDLDFANPGSLRPPPIPYDDPYSIPFEQPTSEEIASMSPRLRQVARPRGRGRGSNIHQTPRGRGGRGGSREMRRGGLPHSNIPRPHNEPTKNFSETHVPRVGPQMQDIRRQTFTDVGFQQTPGWGYPQMPGMMQQPFAGQQGPGYQQGVPFVQPHINPRFAPAFAYSMGPGQSMGYGGQFGVENTYGAGFPGTAPGGYQDEQQQQWNGQWFPPPNSQQG